MDKVGKGQGVPNTFVLLDFLASASSIMGVILQLGTKNIVFLHFSFSYLDKLLFGLVLFILWCPAVIHCLP